MAMLMGGLGGTRGGFAFGNSNSAAVAAELRDARLGGMMYENSAISRQVRRMGR